jgi:hypothetical protein
MFREWTQYVNVQHFIDMQVNMFVMPCRCKVIMDFFFSFEVLTCKPALGGYYLVWRVRITSFVTYYYLCNYMKVKFDHLFNGCIL